MNKVKKTIFSLVMVGGILVGGSTNVFAATTYSKATATSGSSTTTSVVSGNQISTKCTYTWYNVNGQPRTNSNTVSTSGPSTNTATVLQNSNDTNFRATAVGMHTIYGSETIKATSSNNWVKQ